MMKFDPPLFISVAIMNSEQLSAVYALLGGASPATRASGNAPVGGNAPQDTAKLSATEEMQAAESQASDGTGETAMNDASLSDGVVDAHGWPWSADMHASTKNQTGEGLWRMKVGVKRPDPKPGFPVNGTGTKADGPASAVGATATAPTAAVEVEEDDEFAAFTKANAEATADVEVAPRTWADADLSSLCAQAATKLGGDPTKVKEIIARYTPDGETPHSRNVPADDREAFAVEIETLAGITYAG